MVDGRIARTSLVAGMVLVAVAAVGGATAAPPPPVGAAPALQSVVTTPPPTAPDLTDAPAAPPPPLGPPEASPVESAPPAPPPADPLPDPAPAPPADPAPDPAPEPLPDAPPAEPLPVAPPAEPPPGARVVAFAVERLGQPYRFGAPGPVAYDCSGLTRAAFATVGIDLAHHASWQADRGRAVDWRREDLAPGDLVFVRGGRPTHDRGHVGIAVGDGTWIEASASAGMVRQAPIPWTRVQEVRRLLTA